MCDLSLKLIIAAVHKRIVKRKQLRIWIAAFKHVKDRAMRNSHFVDNS
jgi:hypothetical protein